MADDRDRGNVDQETDEIGRGPNEDATEMPKKDDELEDVEDAEDEHTDEVAGSE